MDRDDEESYRYAKILRFALNDSECFVTHRQSAAIKFALADS